MEKVNDGAVGVKAKLRIFRLPRKLVFFMGGILLLGGATGAFALYAGKDGLLGFGPSQKVADLACTTVKTFKIKKKDRFWVRKFIKTEPAEGLARVMTALRVAEAVYTQQQPDLVQVVVLDQNGPEMRAAMRGRAVGADVVYVPHPEKIAELQDTPVYTAKYVDGAATADGQFYGEKIQLPLEHIESLVKLLGDRADCQEPAGVEVKAGDHGKKEEKGHGEAAESHGEATEGHGAEAEQKDGSGDGEEPAADSPVAESGHDAAPEGEAGARQDEAVVENNHAAEGAGEEAPAEEDQAAAGTDESAVTAATGDHATSADKDHAVAEEPADGKALSVAAHAPVPGAEENDAAKDAVKHEEKPVKDQSSAKPVKTHGEKAEAHDAPAEEEHAAEPSKKHAEKAAEEHSAVAEKEMPAENEEQASAQSDEFIDEPFINETN